MSEFVPHHSILPRAEQGAAAVWQLRLALPVMLGVSAGLWALIYKGVTALVG